MSSSRKIFIAALTSIFIFAFFNLVAVRSLSNTVYAHNYTTIDLFDNALAECDSVPEHTIVHTSENNIEFFTCTHPQGAAPGFFSNVPDPVGNQFGSLGQIASELLPFILTLGGMVALLFIIWGGFRYMTAQGDPKSISAARGTIVSAIIGLILLASVIVILVIIQGVFKIEILSSIVTPAYAQGVDIGCEFKLGGQCISDTNVFPDLGSFITAIVNFALAAAGLVFFFMFVWGGLRYMLARGDDKLISDARQTITNSVIGLLIVISSFVIIGIIAAVTSSNISIF